MDFSAHDARRKRIPIGNVMAGLDPAIQTSAFCCWMPGSRPGMTIAHDTPPPAVDP